MVSKNKRGRKSMDSRHGRRHQIPTTRRSSPSYSHPKSGTLVNGLYNFTILCCLTALVYMILEYHCHACNKNSLKAMSTNVEEIARKFAEMQKNYVFMEKKVRSLAKELPKFQGQMEVLEAFANTIETGHYGWDPKSHLRLPYVDVYLNDPKSSGDRNIQENYTNKYPRSRSPIHKPKFGDDELKEILAART